MVIHIGVLPTRSAPRASVLNQLRLSGNGRSTTNCCRADSVALESFKHKEVMCIQVQAVIPVSNNGGVSPFIIFKALLLQAFQSIRQVREISVQPSYPLNDAVPH